MKNIEAIEFVFENCECLTVDSKYIGDLLIEGFETKVRRFGVNAIREYTSCERIDLIIYKDGNTTSESYGDKYKVFDRILSWNDITSIYLKYEDNTEQEIFVPWDDENDCYSNVNNKAQSSFVSDEHLYLTINKDCQNVHDVYTDETVEYLNKNYKMHKKIMK